MINGIESSWGGGGIPMSFHGGKIRRERNVVAWYHFIIIKHLLSVPLRALCYFHILAKTKLWPLRESYNHKVWSHPQLHSVNLHILVACTVLIACNCSESLT